MNINSFRCWSCWKCLIYLRLFRRWLSHELALHKQTNKPLPNLLAHVRYTLLAFTENKNNVLEVMSLTSNEFQDDVSTTLIVVNIARYVCSDSLKIGVLTYLLVTSICIYAYMVEYIMNFGNYDATVYNFSWPRKPRSSENGVIFQRMLNMWIVSKCVWDLNINNVFFMSESQSSYLFTEKNALLSSNSYNFGIKPNI